MNRLNLILKNIVNNIEVNRKEINEQVYKIIPKCDQFVVEEVKDLIIIKDKDGDIIYSDTRSKK